MLERILHHHVVRAARTVRFRSVFAGFLGLKINETGQRQRRRGRE
jgi:hypothetical protein